LGPPGLLPEEPVPGPRRRQRIPDQRLRLAVGFCHDVGQRGLGRRDLDTVTTPLLREGGGTAGDRDGDVEKLSSGRHRSSIPETLR
jgi:hypothetical protein